MVLEGGINLAFRRHCVVHVGCPIVLPFGISSCSPTGPDYEEEFEVIGIIAHMFDAFQPHLMGPSFIDLAMHLVIEGVKQAIA